MSDNDSGDSGPEHDADELAARRKAADKIAVDPELDADELAARRRAVDKIADDPEFDDDSFDPESYQLPKGPKFRLKGPEIFRIGTFAIMLVAIIFLARPCADGIANFVDSFDQKAPPDAGAAKPDPGKFKRLKDMSDSEFRQMVGAPDGSPVPRPAE